MKLVFQLALLYNNGGNQGRIHPPKIRKHMIFWRKIHRHLTILPQATGTCFIQKIYARSSKNFLNETGACGFYAKKSYVF
jgi:hypothetical protein